jgi:hypothetical protein
MPSAETTTKLLASKLRRSFPGEVITGSLIGIAIRWAVAGWPG